MGAGGAGTNSPGSCASVPSLSSAASAAATTAEPCEAGSDFPATSSKGSATSTAPAIAAPASIGFRRPPPGDSGPVTVGGLTPPAAATSPPPSGSAARAGLDSPSGTDKAAPVAAGAASVSGPAVGGAVADVAERAAFDIAAPEPVRRQPPLPPAAPPWMPDAHSEPSAPPQHVFTNLPRGPNLTPARELNGGHFRPVSLGWPIASTPPH